MTTTYPSYASLSLRMAAACGSAVDPWEIAAVLESDGITDAVAHQRYRAADVFALAERLCADHPRRPEPAAPLPSPWRATPVKHLLRGVLFGLPALAYLTVADRVTGVPGALLLVVSVLLSWAGSQALAYLGHVRLGWGDREDAARVLAGGLLWIAVPVVAMIAGLGYGLAVPPAVTLVAAGQAAYVLAATVALVLGREWWLLAALLPGVGAAVAGRGTYDGPLAWCAAGSVLAAVVLAVVTLRGARPRDPRPEELLAAAPNALFGVVVGALLIFVPAAVTFDPAPDRLPGTAAALAALLPLSISMGPAEWLLYRYRSATHRALQQAHTLASFGRQAAGALAVVFAGYVFTLVTLSIAAAALAAGFTGEGPPMRTLAAAALVGDALFVALLLMSFGIRKPVVLVCLLALVADLLLLRVATPLSIQTVTATGLLAALLCLALATLRRASLHH